LSDPRLSWIVGVHFGQESIGIVGIGFRKGLKLGVVTLVGDNENQESVPSKFLSNCFLIVPFKFLFFYAFSISVSLCSLPGSNILQWEELITEYGVLFVFIRIK